MDNVTDNTEWILFANLDDREYTALGTFLHLVSFEQLAAIMDPLCDAEMLEYLHRAMIKLDASMETATEVADPDVTTLKPRPDHLKRQAV